MTEDWNSESCDSGLKSHDWNSEVTGVLKSHEMKSESCFLAQKSLKK